MKADKRTLFCLAILIITFLASCSLAVTPRDPVEGDLAVKPSPVAAPTVTVTDRTAGSGNVTLSLSWEAVEGATQYEVLYQSEDQIFEGDWSSHWVSTNSASLTLSANEVFRITVVASNGYSSSDAGGYALVSTINSIDEVSPVISAGIPSIIIRHPSVSFNGEKILDLVYTIRITNADGSQAMYADGKPVEELIIPNSTYYSFADALAPSSEYAVDVSMYIDNDGTAGYSEGDDLIDSATASFSTDVDSYPDVVSAVSASLVQTETREAAFRLSFTAPPVKKGLEDQDVQRRFRITRNEVGGDSIVVLSETLQCESDDEDSFFLIDSQDLEANRQYTYTVESYYFFSEGNAYNRQSDENGVESSTVNLLSVPENLEASIEGEKTEYTVTLSFDFPFGLEDGHTISLERRETGLQSASDWSSVEFDNQIVDGERVTITSSISLSEDEARRSHSYSYRVTVRYENFTSTAISTPVSTTGTLTELDVIQNLASTSLPLAGKVSLSWDYDDSNLTNGIQEDDLTFTLLRSLSPDYSDAAAVEGDIDFTKGSYVDSTVEDGVTYHYAISVGVSNQSGYEGYSEVDYVSASSLAPISSISASQGEYSDRIELFWSGVEGADGYQVYYRAYGSDGEWILATDDICSPPESDPSTGLWTASFKKDAGTSSAGLSYSFCVKPEDREGNVSQRNPAASAVGNMLGPASITVDVSRGEYSDSILVRWNAIPGATQYLVQGFNGEGEDAMEIFRQSVVPDGEGMSVVFSTDNVSSEAEYSLSQHYWFSITPQYNSQSSVTSTERVEGWWVMPPRDIVASKAASAEGTTISWSPVADASRYYIYRRPLGSISSWQQIASTTDTNFIDYILDSGDNYSNTSYEYTVSTRIGSVEGPVQTWFTTAEDAVLADNVGFPLYHPEDIEVSEVSVGGDYLQKIEFLANSYATSYRITDSIENDVREFAVSSIDEGAVDDSQASDGLAYRVGDQITIFIRRPDVRSSIHYTISVASRNGNIESPVDQISDSYATACTPEHLRLNEVVNFSNTILGEAIDIGNEAFGYDWWNGRVSSDGRPDSFETVVDGEVVISGVRKYGDISYSIGESYMDIKNYQPDGYRLMIESAHIDMELQDSDWNEEGYLGTDYLSNLHYTDLSVILPTGYGSATISHGDNGYTVSYDGQSGSLSDSDVQVAPL